MSYCRKGPDSDVYVIRTGTFWQCLGCWIPGTGQAFVGHSHAEMIDHLWDHLANGDRVPQRALDRLAAEGRHPRE